LRFETLVELAEGVGLELKGMHAESAEGVIGRFDSAADEADFPCTLLLVERMEDQAGL
jgi:hypothetical protein